MTMYLDHFGLSESPFRITPHTDFFFSGANRGATLEALLYAIAHDEGIVKISGEVGSGKTMLCRVLMERLPNHIVIIYLSNPSLSREDILYALADELGIAVPDHSRASVVLKMLQDKLVALYSEGKRVVVLIDEAHAMPRETLEEIRLLSNLESNRHKLLQLVLFGQPELNETLARNDMRQLRERITHNFGLEPLVMNDITAYIEFRMRTAGYRGPNVFSPQALKLIAKASQGLTRRINILSDKALLAAFASGSHQITDKEAKAAIQDSDFANVNLEPERNSRYSKLYWAFGGAIITLAVLLLLFDNQLKSGTPLPDSHLPPLPANNVISAPADSSTAREPSQPALSSPVASPVEVAPSAQTTLVAEQPRTPLLDALLEKSRPWIVSVAANHWFIQLYRPADGTPTDEAEIFLQKLQDTGVSMEQVRGYHVEVGGIERYGIIYGDYASQTLANNAIGGLPTEIRSHHPYPRQAARLKPDNNLRLK